MFLRLGKFFGFLLLCVLGSASSLAVEGDAEFITKIKSGNIDALSPDIGKFWFSDTANKDEIFSGIKKWASKTEAAKLANLTEIILPAMPEYCFDARQSLLVGQHIKYLESVKNFETYKSEMATISTALSTLDNDIRKRAAEVAAKFPSEGLAKELARRSALSTKTEEQNTILFSYGFNKKVSDAAWYFLQEIIIGTQCEYDYNNTEWLKEQIPLIGWPSLAGYTTDVDKAAAFLARHVYDIPFMIKMVEQLQPFYERSEIDQASYKQLQNTVMAYQATTDQVAKIAAIYPDQTIRPPRMCHTP
jgi:hypothetical protein